jgi:hypothetical protein
MKTLDELSRLSSFAQRLRATKQRLRDCVAEAREEADAEPAFDSLGIGNLTCAPLSRETRLQIADMVVADLKAQIRILEEDLLAGGIETKVAG